MASMHPIRVASLRTGLSEALLRAWETRHHALSPARTRTGRRLYSDEDIERLRLLRRAVAAGRRISEIARLSTNELDALSREDEDARGASGIGAPSRSRDPHLAECLAAVEALDADRLRGALHRALGELGAGLLRRAILVPLMLAIGRRWSEGSLRIVHEHLASAIVGAFVSNLARAELLPGSAPRIVVSTPPGHLHELGALLAAAAAAEVGWRTTYLGPSLPAEEIAAGAILVGARAVALSLVHPPADARVADELRALRRQLGPERALLLGGQAATSYRVVAGEIGAIVCRDLEGLQQELRIRAGESAADVEIAPEPTSTPRRARPTVEDPSGAGRRRSRPGGGSTR